MSLQPVSIKQLRYWFNRINCLAFDGKLAKTVLQIVDSNEWVACTGRCRVLTPKKDKKWDKERLFVIKINKKTQFSRSLVVISLAHEMIHVEHWGWGHGTRFENRMLEVIKAAKLERFL